MMTLDEKVEMIKISLNPCIKLNVQPSIKFQEICMIL